MLNDDTNVCCHCGHKGKKLAKKEHTFESAGLILSQGGCLTHNQGQMLATEPYLVGVVEPENPHLQHLIPAHVETQAGPPVLSEARAHPGAEMVKGAARSTAVSPLTTIHAIDLSALTDEQGLLMPGERTPTSYGEVPGFVMARIKGENSPAEWPANSSTPSQKRSRRAARVCLEKRFNTVSAHTPRQKDTQPTVLSNFLTIFQQSAEAQRAVIHQQMQTWMTTARANPVEDTSSYVGGVFNPVTNMCGQVVGHIPHMVEPFKHQGLIIPKSLSFNFCPERADTNTHNTSSSNQTEEKQLVNIEDDVVTPAASMNCGSAHISRPIKASKAAQYSAGESVSRTRKRARSCMSYSQRREKHNSKERERRLGIRVCCDKLNMLVPFCDSDTDKLTTLQWTAAFLGYINKMYGDTFKEEFQKTYSDKKAFFLKSSPSSGQDTIHREMGEILPLAVEQ